jgi:hypothetical protein
MKHTTPAMVSGPPRKRTAAQQGGDSTEHGSNAAEFVPQADPQVKRLVTKRATVKPFNSLAGALPQSQWQRLLWDIDNGSEAS